MGGNGDGRVAECGCRSTAELPAAQPSSPAPNTLRLMHSLPPSILQTVQAPKKTVKGTVKKTVKGAGTAKKSILGSVFGSRD